MDSELKVRVTECKWKFDTVLEERYSYMKAVVITAEE